MLDVGTYSLWMEKISFRLVYSWVTHDVAGVSCLVAGDAFKAVGGSGRRCFWRRHERYAELKYSVALV